MAKLDLEQLLNPISDEAPCGENLEYELDFGEMERAAQGKTEQQFGDTVIEAEEPDWRDLERKCISLMKRTKDLRVVVYLSRALLKTDGIEGFQGCLSLLRGYVEHSWETVHPQLDPDDDNDPLLRVNTLAQLSDNDTTLGLLKRCPLVRSKALGAYGLFDIDLANSDTPVTEDDERPEMATIEAAFLDCELEDLQSTAAAVRGGIEDITALEAELTEKVGVGQATSFEPLVRLLKEADQVLTSQLERRGISENDSGDETEEGNEEGNGATGQRLTGEITSREDVLRALDKICDYYNRFEPSSPLPLLLTRAKRLATKSFLEIIRDLTPEAFSQAESLAGLSSEAQDHDVQ